jgi:hypothetical protein
MPVRGNPSPAGYKELMETSRGSGNSRQLGSKGVWERWMALVLRRAEQVGLEGEIPVAAVVLDEEGRCIGWGSNRRHRHSC